MSTTCKVPAKCGCEGCCLDEKGCPVDDYIDKNGLPMPPKKDWPCVDENGTYIFKETNNE